MKKEGQAMCLPFVATENVVAYLIASSSISWRTKRTGGAP